MKCLTESECKAALDTLDGWSLHFDPDRLSKSFDFKDFNAAFGWMTRIALAAEKMDHHPEWRNIYNRVEVTLSTHDAGGITQRDIILARIMNEIA